MGMVHDHQIRAPFLDRRPGIEFLIPAPAPGRVLLSGVEADHDGVDALLPHPCDRVHDVGGVGIHHEGMIVSAVQDPLGGKRRHRAVVALPPEVHDVIVRDRAGLNGAFRQDFCEIRRSPEAKGLSGVLHQGTVRQRALQIHQSQVVRRKKVLHVPEKPSVAFPGRDAVKGVRLAPENILAAQGYIPGEGQGHLFLPIRQGRLRRFFPFRRLGRSSPRRRGILGRRKGGRAVRYAVPGGRGLLRRTFRPGAHGSGDRGPFPGAFLPKDPGRGVRKQNSHFHDRHGQQYQQLFHPLSLLSLRDPCSGSGRFHTVFIWTASRRRRNR